MNVRHPAVLVLMVAGALLTFGADRISRHLNRPEHMMKIKIAGCALVIISAVILLDLF